MTAFSRSAAALGLILLVGCSGETAPQTGPVPPEAGGAMAAAATAEPAPDVSQLPAGAYKLDPSHASLIFQVNHLGFSHYTASFRTFTADLMLDPAAPEKATVKATVDVASLSLPTPPTGFVEELLGSDWLGLTTTSTMLFESTGVTMTGADTADIVGNLTLKGVTQPITLHAKFNGGYPGHPQDPNARIGFAATGVLKRSAFGIDLGIPVPPSTMGVSDEVEFEINAEFSGPALQDAPAATTPAP